MAWLKEAADDDSLLKELSVAIDVPVEDMKISETESGVWEVGAGNQSYRVFESDNKAKEVALEQVIDRLENEPEMFHQDWLQNFIYVLPGDRPILANEGADSQIEGMRDADILEKADMVEEYDAEQDDNKKEAILEAAREEASSILSDEIEEQLENPIQYFVHDQGMYSMKDLMKASFISLDIPEAAQEAINVDGWEYFLATYDGNSEELPSGAVYIRTN